MNLALLCGYVGRYGSGLQPLRSQNNVRGGGDTGVIGDRLPGFGDTLDDEVLAVSTLPRGEPDPAPVRHAPDADVAAMEWVTC